MAINHRASLAFVALVTLGGTADAQTFTRVISHTDWYKAHYQQGGKLLLHSISAVGGIWNMCAQIVQAGTYPRNNAWVVVHLTNAHWVWRT